MEVRSVYKSARVSPKKARDVAREIQGLPVSDALNALTFTPRKAAFLINKTLKSAIANAENNHDLAADGLVVKEAVVTDGPTFRRFKPRARGSASGIRKRTSHIRIILSDEIVIEDKPARTKTSKPKAKASPKQEVVEADDVEVTGEEAVEAEVPAAEDTVEESPAAEDAPEAPAEDPAEADEEKKSEDA